MRASLVPAAAVIPAHLVYIKVVADKKLVVDHLVLAASASAAVRECYLLENFIGLNWSMMLIGHFPEKKLECSKQANALNITAWNNRIRLKSLLLVMNFSNG